jgi:hypothetical protein
MDRAEAVIEDAKIHDIYDLFSRKPSGLKFNDTDALVIAARKGDGGLITRTFYFCLKPDGTFSEDALNGDGSRSRRQRLAAFMRYYGLAKDPGSYNLKERVGEWIGVKVEILPEKGIIYIP